MVKGALAVKNAWETGELIGTSGCAEPRSYQGLVPMDLATCRIYVGQTTDGTLGDIPGGTWGIWAVSPGWEPMWVDEVSVAEGTSTQVDGSGWSKLPPPPGGESSDCVNVTVDAEDLVGINPVYGRGTDSGDQFRVYADPSCCWRATSNSSWLEINYSEGSVQGERVCGDGRVHLIGYCNCTDSNREAIVTVGAEQVTIEQWGQDQFDGACSTECR